MKAISVGQLDGFPPKDVLRTVYVAHDIDASESQVRGEEAGAGVGVQVVRGCREMVGGWVDGWGTRVCERLHTAGGGWQRQ